MKFKSIKLIYFGAVVFGFCTAVSANGSEGTSEESPYDALIPPGANSLDALTYSILMNHMKRPAPQFLEDGKPHVTQYFIMDTHLDGNGEQIQQDSYNVPIATTLPDQMEPPSISSVSEYGVSPLGTHDSQYLESISSGDELQLPLKSSSTQFGFLSSESLRTKDTIEETEHTPSFLEMTTTNTEAPITITRSTIPVIESSTLRQNIPIQSSISYQTPVSKPIENFSTTKAPIRIVFMNANPGQSHSQITFNQPQPKRIITPQPIFPNRQINPSFILPARESPNLVPNQKLFTSSVKLSQTEIQKVLEALASNRNKVGSTANPTQNHLPIIRGPILPTQSYQKNTQIVQKSIPLNFVPLESKFYAESKPQFESHSLNSIRTIDKGIQSQNSQTSSPIYISSSSNNHYTVISRPPVSKPFIPRIVNSSFGSGTRSVAKTNVIEFNKSKIFTNQFPPGLSYEFFKAVVKEM